MAHRFDVAVVGLGTMGAFACLELARRRVSVVGFDRFAPPHGRGSHSGDSRVYREAYAEHPDYVPIAKRAGELWDRFGREGGTTLLHRSGMLSIGGETSALLAGIRESATRHALRVERLSAEEIRRRFPAFEPPAGAIGLFEPAAGWIDVDAALRFGIREARRFGAEIRLNTVIGGCVRAGSGFVLRTSEGTVEAGRVIVALGAWGGSLLKDLALPLRVLRKVLIWIDPVNPDLFRPDRFPIFACTDRFFYGFPDLDGKGVKLGIHLDPSAPDADPDGPECPVRSAEMEPILAMAAEWLPSLGGALPEAASRVRSARTCLYTMTPDEHFIIGRHPVLENLWIAAGFSGHGFKFAPAIGEVLADLAMDGRPALGVGFLGLDRFIRKGY